MSTLITLIRHAETEWNRNGRWQGHTDVPLSERGRQQAHRLAQRLGKERPRCDHLYTSDLSRALETAQIISTALGRLPSPLLELREINVGLWSGLSRQEIIRRFPEEWAEVEAGRDVRRGGGESYAELQIRVIRALQRLIDEHQGQQLWLVTHGGVIGAVLAHVLRMEPHQRVVLASVENTSLSTVSITRKGWSMVRFNDVAHLAGLDSQIDMPAPAIEAVGERPL